MANEKPLALKIFGWILYVGANLLKAAFEISTPKSTESYARVHSLYENGDITLGEFMRKKQEMGMD